MDALQLLEELGRVEVVDADVLDRTADTLKAAIAVEERHRTDGDLADAHRLIAAPSGVGSDDRHEERRRSRHGGGRRRQRSSLRAAVTVVVVVAAVGIAGALKPGTPGGPTPAAAAVLKHLALVAAGQPAGDVPGPGHFLYVESDEAYTSTTGGSPSYTVLMPEHRQIWIGPDGSGRLDESYGQPEFLSAQDHADWVAAGSPPLPHAPSDTSFGPGGLSLMDLSHLPTDPSSLAAQISSRQIEGGPPGTAEDFTQIGDLLRETDASPALRSALYQVAASLRGITSLGTVTDHAGRPGIGVAYVHGGEQDELVFDPQTSALLGEQNSVVGPGSAYRVGTVFGWIVFRQSAVVDSTATGPNGAPVPLPPASSAASPAVPIKGPKSVPTGG